MSDPKATIYDSRRECLIASVGDTRRVFVATSIEPARIQDWTHWGLATTEHEFRKALSEKLWAVSRLTRNDLQTAMAEELTGGDK